MHKSLFIIVFTNHNIEEIYAFSLKEAIILAQAKQINKGNLFHVDFVKDKEGNILKRG